MGIRLYTIFMPGLFALLFGAGAYPARLTPGQVSMHIEMADTFSIYQDIPFRVVLTPAANGELVTWDTAAVYVNVYRLDEQGIPLDGDNEIIASDLDRRNENAVVYEGADESEMGFQIYPDAEFVSVGIGIPYVREASFEQDVYPEAQASAELLGPGHYKMAVEYIFAIQTDDDYEDEDAASLKAEAEFRLTTEGEVEESINYWLGILRDADANERYVRSAWLLLEDYLGQVFRASTEGFMAMTVREDAVTEYFRWWKHNKDKVTMIVEDDGSERLERSPRKN